MKITNPWAWNPTNPRTYPKLKNWNPTNPHPKSIHLGSLYSYKILCRSCTCSVWGCPVSTLAEAATPLLPNKSREWGLWHWLSFLGVEQSGAVMALPGVGQNYYTSLGKVPKLSRVIMAFTGVEQKQHRPVTLRLGKCPLLEQNYHALGKLSRAVTFLWSRAEQSCDNLPGKILPCQELLLLH